MRPERLTAEELAVIDNPEDIPYLEIIKGMSLDEMKSFDVYCPKSIEHYNRKQTEWLAMERHLIGKRPGHGELVTSKELIEDMENYHNENRFKVWYVLKYSSLVNMINKSSKTISQPL